MEVIDRQDERPYHWTKMLPHLWRTFSAKDYKRIWSDYQEGNQSLYDFVTSGGLAPRQPYDKKFKVEQARKRRAMFDTLGYIPRVPRKRLRKDEPVAIINGNSKAGKTNHKMPYRGRMYRKRRRSYRPRSYKRRRSAFVARRKRRVFYRKRRMRIRKKSKWTKKMRRVGACLDTYKCLAPVRLNKQNDIGIATNMPDFYTKYDAYSFAEKYDVLHGHWYFFNLEDPFCPLCVVRPTQNITGGNFRDAFKDTAVQWAPNYPANKQFATYRYFKVAAVKIKYIPNGQPIQRVPDRIISDGIYNGKNFIDPKHSRDLNTANEDIAMKLTMRSIYRKDMSAPGMLAAFAYKNSDAIEVPSNPAGPLPIEDVDCLGFTDNDWLTRKTRRLNPYKKHKWFFRLNGGRYSNSQLWMDTATKIDALNMTVTYDTFHDLRRFKGGYFDNRDQHLLKLATFTSDYNFKNCLAIQFSLDQELSIARGGLSNETDGIKDVAVPPLALGHFYMKFYLAFSHTNDNIVDAI